MVNKKLISILLIIISISITLIISVGSNNPSVHGHLAQNVLVTMNNPNNGNDYTMTLQQAIDNDFFTYGIYPEQDYTTELFHGHSGDEIEIVIDGNEMTLQSAIDSLEAYSDIFCLGGDSSNFNIDIGHDSYEISFNGETKTLQQAINDFDLCSCGDGTCSQDENCINCQRDCGGCVKECHYDGLSTSASTKYTWQEMTCTNCVPEYAGTRVSTKWELDRRTSWFSGTSPTLPQDYISGDYKYSKGNLVDSYHVDGYGASRDWDVRLYKICRIRISG